jgi:hypothetical protein
MFYAMQTLKDSYNPKLFHVRAIRQKPYKHLRAAIKAAAKHEMGFVTDSKRNILYV